MAMLPVLRRETAPLAVRSTARPRPVSEPEPEPEATATDKVATADESELLKQQQAFDRLTAFCAEQQREANVIRDMAMEQLKRDEEVLKKWIEMI